MKAKAVVLERLAARADFSDEERAALLTAVAHLRDCTASTVPGEARRSQPDRFMSGRRPSGGLPDGEIEAASRDDGPTHRERLRLRTAVPSADAILWSDGAARGNPGPAGAGAVLKSPNGEILAEISGFLGHTTNNVAEYRALLMGLEQALALGVKRLEIRADSELLIKQLLGSYRVKDPKLKPLWQEAKQLLARFDLARLQHVPRAQNSDADRLANAGIDGR